MNYLEYITSPKDLVTSYEETRSGFISMALEKNQTMIPFVEEAKVLKNLLDKKKDVYELMGDNELKPSLVTAAGFSVKSISHLTDDIIDAAINELIEKFLEPAGKAFREELVYRYLLIKGDSFGGRMRNITGALAEKKIIRTIIATLSVKGIDFEWMDKEKNKWKSSKPEDIIERNVKALYWQVNKVDRLFLLNINVPVVEKNVDLNLINSNPDNLILIGSKEKTAKSIHKNLSAYLALGELKGGIDPAGADEHWKTARTSLNRIREGFDSMNLEPKTFFIGAAIQTAMAEEIFMQLENNQLSNVANLTKETQLTSICNWLVSI